MREEGGTPAIVESIRAGMVMQLKDSVGAKYIISREEKYLQMAKTRLETVPNLEILGSKSNPRLPVLSFLIKNPDSGLYLHHNFICAILNDVFGVQARGGCACAGPYAQHLLGIDKDMAKDYENMLIEDDRLDREHLRRGHSEYSSYEMLRPGFARLNLPWFASEEEIGFVLDALEMIADQGWKLLPQYRMNNETGDWKHFSNLEYKERTWLGNISYVDGTFKFNDKFEKQPSDDETINSFRRDYHGIMDKAREIFDEAKKEAGKKQIPDQRILFEEGSSAHKLR